MPFDYIWFVDPSDHYYITRDNSKLLRTIQRNWFWYTITMNQYFQVVYLDSNLCCDDESPLEVCQCINTLVNYIEKETWKK